MRPNVFLRKKASKAKSKKRKVHYYLVIRIPGRKDESVPLGNVSRDFAARQRQQYLQEIYSGTFRPAIKTRKTFREFGNEFLEFASGCREPKTLDSYRGCLKPILTHLGDYQLSQITGEKLDKVLCGRNVSNRTKNLTLSTLRFLFRKAIEWDYLDDDPSSKIKWLKKTKVKVSRALTYAELKALWDVLNPWQKSRLKVFVFSGLRNNELTYLRLKDIDWQENKLVVKKGKGGKQREIPLSPDLRAELETLKDYHPVIRGNCRTPYKPRLAHQREYVFCHEDGSPVKSSRKAIDNAFKKAGIEGVTIHGLRKTFGSLLARQGVHVKVAQELMGHADPSLTLEIYTQVEDDQKKDAVKLLPTEHDMKMEKFRVVQGEKQ